MSVEKSGTELQCGRRFSATDWRANRLADALAKEAATREGASSYSSLQKRQPSVTRAANHHPVPVTLPCGKTVISIKRDSVPPPRKSAKAEKVRKLIKFELEEFEVSDFDPLDVDSKRTLPRKPAAKHTALRAKEEASKTAKRKAGDAAAATLKRTLDELCSNCKPCAETPSAASRTSAVLARILAKHTRTGE